MPHQQKFCLKGKIKKQIECNKHSKKYMIFTNIKSEIFKKLTQQNRVKYKISQSQYISTRQMIKI